MSDKDWQNVLYYSKIAIISTIFLIIVLIGLSNANEVDLTRAVIHHTASHDVSAATIDRWHKERGWDGIGYHFVIRWDGTVEPGRSLSKKGAHAKGRNQYIGIALTGYDTFSDLQKEALKKLLRRLGVRHIERHHENCPGPSLVMKGLLDE